MLGCREVTILDGRVPGEYLAAAQKLEGHYVGHWGTRAAEVEIHFDGDRPYLTFKDASGNDLLGVDCRSKIGFLQRIKPSKNKDVYNIVEAEFALDPGQCGGITGRTIELEFTDADKKSLVMKILDHTEHRIHCDGLRSGPCRHETEYIHLTGHFAPLSGTESISSPF
jgi:hypothetical protein